MYGKHWASMYQGSMQGAGSAFFAVWGYVISHMQPNLGHGTIVELNTKLIAFLIGEKLEVVEAVIDKMCKPDLKSSTKDEDGRKLVKIGEYAYRVVNGDHYRKMRNEQERREYQKNKQAEYRAKKRAIKNGTPLKGYTDKDGVDHPSEDAALREPELDVSIPVDEGRSLYYVIDDQRRLESDDASLYVRRFRASTYKEAADWMMASGPRATMSVDFWDAGARQWIYGVECELLK